MAVLFAASADLNDLTIWDAYSSFVYISTDVTARTGTKTFKLINTSSYLAQYFDNKSELYGRVAIYDLGEFRVAFRNSGTTMVTININRWGITVYRGTTSGSVICSQKVTSTIWGCYEFRIVRSETVGVVQIKFNGALVINESNLNTNDADFDGITLAPGENTAHYVDDILFDDANWPGLGGIEVIRPDADGNYTGWSAGNYSNVADDSDATYVANDAETTAKDSYEVPALAADRQTPNAVIYFVKAQLSEAGSGTLRPFSRKDGADFNGTSVNLSTGLTYYREIFTAYPDEVGLEVVV